jgi:hypothetical protein
MMICDITREPLLTRVSGKGAAVSVLEDLRGIEERVVARLKELRPLVDEYAELERVAARLGFEVPSSTTARPASARRGRRKPAARALRKLDTRRRPGGTQATGAERRARVLELVKERPGITVPEIAGEIGVDPPPIYRVIRKLQAEGVVKKEGKSLALA